MKNIFDTIKCFFRTSRIIVWQTDHIDHFIEIRAYSRMQPLLSLCFVSHGQVWLVVLSEFITKYSMRKATVNYFGQRTCKSFLTYVVVDNNRCLAALFSTLGKHRIRSVINYVLYFPACIVPKLIWRSILFEMCTK